MNFQHNFFEETAKKYPEYIAVDDHGNLLNFNQVGYISIFLSIIGIFSVIKLNNHIKAKNV